MFDNIKQSDNKVSELVRSIYKLANTLETCPNGSHREKTLNEALKLAHQFEGVMNQQDERISYLEHLSVTDSLTGILNRRGFQSETQRVLASSRRFNETGLLAYVDLDGFKFINDTYGHACGDAVLCHVARLLERTTRGMDYVARLGGDEFGILIVRSDWQNAQKRIAKIATELNNTHISWKNLNISVKASVGMQRYDNTSLTHDLMTAADASMYAIKKVKDELKQDVCTLNAAQ